MNNNFWLWKVNNGTKNLLTVLKTNWFLEAQESAENFTTELDQVKMTLKQTEEEKNRLEEELTRVNIVE